MYWNIFLYFIFIIQHRIGAFRHKARIKQWRTRSQLCTSLREGWVFNSLFKWWVTSVLLPHTAGTLFPSRSIVVCLLKTYADLFPPISIPWCFYYIPYYLKKLFAFAGIFLFVCSAWHYVPQKVPGNYVVCQHFRQM